MAASERIHSLLAALLLVPTLFSSPALALDEGASLMMDGRWREAEKHYAERAGRNASDADARLNLGICRLRLGDFGGADAAFADAVAANPTFSQGVARTWKMEGTRALKDGKPDRALAFYAKALVLTPSEAPALGTELLEAADRLEDETERARIVSRAAKWAGAEEAAHRSALYFRKKLGPARSASLDETGWAKIGKLRTGDRLYYLSTEPIRQKDGGSLRILPATVEIPLRLTVEEKDTNGTGETDVLLGKHEKPARVWFWLMPGGG